MRKFLPPAYFWLGILFIILIYFSLPFFRVIHYPFTLLGIPLIALGIFLNWWSDKLFKEYKTTVKPDEKPSRLITGGPFKISRNPMYLGMLLMLLGLSVLSGNLIGFISPIIFCILINKLFIPPEEKNMEKEFEKKYLKYKNKVRRWI